MRLTCPTCGAEYEAFDGMIPAAGRHVQCTACHTRWFVHAPQRQKVSEEQILTRLEARPRPVLVPVADPRARAASEDNLDLQSDEPEPAAPRLDLAEAGTVPTLAPPPPRSRFLRGMLIVLVPALVAFGAYRYHGEIASRFPEAEPALDGYTGFVDDLRDEVQGQIDAFRGEPAAPSVE
jgi:predicted Zn finger-like uncharacterized protein